MTRIQTETEKRFNEKVLEVNNLHRNEVLEEVAKEIEKMTAFGDTAASFAQYVREMKQ
jgi:uncharacterized surface protein with fasciclin (FAS1) repeats